MGDQVDIEDLIVKADLPLTGDEGETLSQFEQESLQVVDNGLLQRVFAQRRGVRKSEKLILCIVRTQSVHHTSAVPRQ